MCVCVFVGVLFFSGYPPCLVFLVALKGTKGNTTSLFGSFVRTYGTSRKTIPRRRSRRMCLSPPGPERSSLEGKAKSVAWDDNFSSAPCELPKAIYSGMWVWLEVARATQVLVFGSVYVFDPQPCLPPTNSPSCNQWTPPLFATLFFGKGSDSFKLNQPKEDALFFPWPLGI